VLRRAGEEAAALGAAQRCGAGLQWLVGRVGAVLVQNLVLPDGDFEIGGVEAGVDRNDHRVAAQRRADRRIGHRAADLPAGQDERRDPLGLERAVELGLVEPVLGLAFDLDVALRRRNLGQPFRHGRRAGPVGDGDAGLPGPLEQRRNRGQHSALAVRLARADRIDDVEDEQRRCCGVKRHRRRIGRRRHLQCQRSVAHENVPICGKPPRRLRRREAPWRMIIRIPRGREDDSRVTRYDRAAAPIAFAG
jgi:hypothetical protein